MTALHTPRREPWTPVINTPPHSFIDKSRLYILLAEDNTVNQTLATRMLEKQGHTVITVSDGQAALDALTDHTFDLVLMDVQMPVMDGLAATAMIRQRESQTGGHLPVIAMTAHAMKGDAEHCLAAGMDGYLSKPIKADELCAVIQKTLHHESMPDACSAEPPVDIATLMTIVGGEKDLMMDLGRIFRQDYPKQVAALREAIRQGDRRGIEHIAHSLRGALATIGATTARSLAYELEHMGQTSQLERAQSVFHKLEVELSRLAAFLDDLSWVDPM